MKFSEKLQKLRKEKGYSQEQLADLLEVSRQSVSKWESGTTYPEMDKLLMLCKIFNVTLDDLTNDEVTDKAIKEKSKGTLNNFIYALLDMINKSVEMFKNMSKKDLMKCITEMLIVIFILLILNLPFQYINDLARDIFLNFGHKAYAITYSIWNFFTSIIYLVLFIAIFVYVYKTRYLDKFDFQNITKEKEEEKEEMSSEKDNHNVKERREDKHSFILFDVLGSIFNFIVKMCLLFICIPIICVFFMFIFLGVIAFILLLKGITYPGILISLLGCILLSGLVMEIAIRFLVNAEFKFKRLFWLFVSGITICGVGGAISTFEIAETEFINTVPETEKVSTKNFEFSMNENLYINSGHRYYYYPQDIEYVVDESLNDKVLIAVDYYDNFVTVNVDDSDNQIFIYTWEAPYVVKNSYNLLMDNLKNKRIYNYAELSEIDIVVKTSSPNIEKLKQNYKKHLEEERKQNRENEYTLYYNQINELTLANDSLQEKLNEANDTISDLQDKINEIENLIK